MSEIAKPRKGSNADIDWQSVNVAPTPPTPASLEWERHASKLWRLVRERAGKWGVSVKCVAWDEHSQEWDVTTEHTTSIVYRVGNKVASRPLSDEVVWSFKPIAGWELIDVVDLLLEEIAAYDDVCRTMRRRASKVERMVEQIADEKTPAEVRKAFEDALDAEVPRAEVAS